MTDATLSNITNDTLTENIKLRDFKKVGAEEIDEYKKIKISILRKN